MKSELKKQLTALLPFISVSLLLIFLSFRFEIIASFLRSFLGSHPYFIALVSSFFSTISILIPLFSYPFYLIMIALLRGSFGNIFLIVTCMGLGATLGDLLSYLITYFPSLRFLRKDKHKEKISSTLSSWKEKLLNPLRERGIHLEETWALDFVLSFIFGIFPLPDDLLMLYFGFERRDLKPILIGNWLGRSFMYLFIYLGLFSISGLLKWLHIFF